MSKTSFYLHSFKNRHLYPPTKYPLTHLIDNQNIQQRLSKQSIYVQHFKYTFFSSLLFVLINIIVFEAHIYVYNSLFGPFHRNLDEFSRDINTYPHFGSWFWKKEYIQIELGENNIQNTLNTYDSIKKYSDQFTGFNHIATYKKVNKPNIYVKLPTRSQKNFHRHFSFDFLSFSNKTFQCIVKNLQSNLGITYQTWIEKSEYVKYINEEYAKNSTLFNMLILTKCGILSGYLYRPVDEKVFIRNRKYQFSNNDMAFNTTHQYSSYYLLLIGSLIFLWSFLKSLFYLLIYSSNIIRFKLFYKYGLLLFPLYLSSDVLEQLWLLNIDDTPHKQLLQLDELIQQTKYKLNNQLFIIKNHFEQLFVILIKRKLDENLDIKNDLSLFIVCPVTDIKKIVQSRGICYGEDSSWIPWPSTITGEQNYSEWLHEELMEISEHYQNQYAYRLRNERENESEDMWNFLNLHSYSDTVYRRHELPEIERSNERELEELIREEQNFQHFRLERQYFYEQTSAASPEFIAKFRIEHKLNKNLINSNMEKDNLKCTICYDDLKLNDSYAKWPCPSIIPHIFHYNCMLKILRRSNICPLCRYPIESHYIIPQFFRNFLF